jgi:hypothetical protein
VLKNNQKTGFVSSGDSEWNLGCFSHALVQLKSITDAKVNGVHAG